MKQLNYIDLFAGCGGLSDGFEQVTKYRILAGVEWENSPCETFRNRLKTKWGYKNAEKIVIRFDIQRLKELLNGFKDDPIYGSHSGLNELTRKSDKVDLIIGGPPCQAYSIAGRIRDEYGMHYDYRNYLFESYVELVKKFRPKMFIFENVPGIFSASPAGISIINRIKKAFSKISYEISENLREDALTDFSLYKVPQNRTRAIIVGLDRKIFGKDCQKQIKFFYHDILSFHQSFGRGHVKDAIGNLKAFYPAKEPYRYDGRWFSHAPHKDTLYGHNPRFHSARDISIFRELARDVSLGNRKYKTVEDLKNLYTKKTGKVSNVHKYYVLRWKEQSNTIPAHLFKDGLRHIHPDPEQARSITVREAARLQTFDDDFVFLGSQGDQYKMIGNAVPPLFAKTLASAIFEFYKKCIHPKS